MRLEIEHDIGVDAARRKIDGFLDQLAAAELPAGVRVTDTHRSWSGDVMELTFKLKKGFFGATISGRVTVQERLVIIDVDIPGIVTSFVNEDEIRNKIEHQARALLESAE